MSEQRLQMPLNTAEVKALAGLARFVDQCSATRGRLSAAPSLMQIIEIIEDLGFGELTAELLIRARHHLSCTGWIWQGSMGPFRDHLYILSLVTLIEKSILQAMPHGHHGPAGSSQASSLLGASTSSAQQPPFSGAANLPGTAPTLDQALETVRAHGYLPLKLDSLFDILDTDAGGGRAKAR